MDAEPDGAAGDVLGPYRLDRLLGRGGMGAVHRAWDGRRRRWVALKLLDPWTAGDPEFRRRFRREAELAARLTDPHVLPVHDYGEIDGRLFLDMRLVDGPDLAHVLHAGRISPARVLPLLGQVASALDAAHADGLVHRDVKPSNVLVAAGDFAYVVDFGIARDLAAAADRPLDGARAGSDTTTFGTVGYVAPERLRGAPADGRGDVYSLACVAFECLTGRRPYVGDDPAAVVDEQLHGPVPRPHALDPSLPEELDAVLARGLAGSPDDRYPDAASLVRAIAAAFVGAPTGEPRDGEPGGRADGEALPPTRRGPPDAVRRRPGLPRAVLWTGAAVAAVLVVVLAVVLVRGYVGDGVSVGLSPIAVAAAPEGDHVLVVGGGTRVVTVVDPGADTGGADPVTRRVELPGRAVGASSDGSRLDITTVDGRPENALVIVDTSTTAVVGTTALPAPPTGPPALTRDRSRAAVPTRSGVAVVDPLTGSGPTLPSDARSVAIADTGRVYTVDGRSTTIGVLDPGGTAGAPIAVGAVARDLRLLPDGRTLAVVDDAPALSLVDTADQRVIARIPLPGRPSGLTVTPDGGQVLVGTDRAPGVAGPGVVAVDLRAGRVVDAYPREPYAAAVALAVSPDGGLLYVANTDLGTLTVDPLRHR